MNETTTVSDGMRSLLAALRYGSPTFTASFDTESEELVDFLAQSAYISTDDVRDIGTTLDGGHSRKAKTRVRYLAALFDPNLSLHDLSNRIHYVLDNGHLSISEVRDILRGGKGDIPLEKIQAIGEELRSGTSVRAAAAKVGVAVDTAAAIENFLGIAEQRRLDLVDKACYAVRDGISTRKFAEANDISKSTAHNLMVRAREVLKELGEL